MKGEVMYKVELTEGEIRAILVGYYRILEHFERYVKEYDPEANVSAESVEKAKEHIEARADYLITKLDTGC